MELLRVMLLTYTRTMIRLSNCGGLSRMLLYVERNYEFERAVNQVLPQSSLGANATLIADNAL